MKKSTLIVVSLGACIAAALPGATAGRAASTPSPPTALSWSPDGRSVAFVRRGGLWVASTQRTGPARRLATVLDVGRPYAWRSPRELVAADRAALRLVSRDGRIRRALVRGNFRFEPALCFCSSAGRSVFDLARDRRLLVARRWRRRGTETFLVDLTSGRVRMLHFGRSACPRCVPWQPQFVPRRDSVAFIELLPVAGGRFGIVRRPLGRSRVTVLVDDLRVEDGPAWSPDGASFAYSAYAEVYYPETPTHVRLRRAGSDIALGLGSNPRWSPDGARLTFDGPFGGGTSMIVVAETMAVRELRRTTGVSWSPDGSRTGFVRDSMLTVGDADGNDPRTLSRATPGFGAEPTWSPDGRWIAFARADDPGVWIVRPDGSELRKVATG